MSYVNKGISFCGLNVDCFLVDLTLFRFGNNCSEILGFVFLFKVLRLNDNRLYDTPENLQSCNLADIPNFVRCVLL